jgi:outer membrane biosynthesis protein TonB
MDAVKKWRYEPYQLDGKPVKNKTMITVEFKLPSSAK